MQRLLAILTADSKKALSFQFFLKFKFQTQKKNKKIKFLYKTVINYAPATALFPPENNSRPIMF
jgi:hypothetical protein